MRRAAAATILLTALAATACQTAPQGMQLIEGRWNSTDGIFYANFGNGQFTSRFVQTDEVLANGQYRQAEGGGLQLDWFSIRTQSPATALCNFEGPDTLVCNQVGATPFTLTRA